MTLHFISFIHLSKIITRIRKPSIRSKDRKSAELEAQKQSLKLHENLDTLLDRPPEDGVSVLFLLYLYPG